MTSAEYFELTQKWCDEARAYCRVTVHHDRRALDKMAELLGVSAVYGYKGKARCPRKRQSLHQKGQ